MSSSDVRSSFDAAAKAFLEIADNLDTSQFDIVALGKFNIRDLLGHTGRALSTIENYMLPAAQSSSQITAADYFAALWKPAGTEERRLRDENIYERGKSEALRFGQDIRQALHTLAERITALVRSAADNTALDTPVGQMQLIEYLPTRTFELCVHSLDLAKASNQAVPVCLEPVIEATLILAARMAVRNNDGPGLLLALCGRQKLPDGYSII